MDLLHLSPIAVELHRLCSLCWQGFLKTCFGAAFIAYNCIIDETGREEGKIVLAYALKSEKN